MSEKQDRPITVTFSLRISLFNKLLDLCKASGKNRSQLLASWIDHSWVGYDSGTPEPAAPPGNVT
ncbi:MAG: hypothetical protein C0401_06495 [Anaerolinea sp.]|nr:hypothetical protein [Anaerolinea sp.]